MPNGTSQRGLAEVFGHPVDDDSVQAQLDRKAHRCPFLGQTCWKQSRLIDYPFGVCSVDDNGETIVTCPSRFRQDERVFKNIADHHFGTQHNLVSFPEVSVSVTTSGGRRILYVFDYVQVKHKPLSSEVEDFVVIEVQTVDTTNTSGLVDALNDFVAGRDLQETYGFGLNWSGVWKDWFPQILRTSVILERWGHRIYWVAQEPTYECLLDTHGLTGMTFDSAHSTVFMVYDIVQERAQSALSRTRIESVGTGQLIDGLLHEAPIPSKDDFVRTLKDRIQEIGREAMRL